MHSLCPTGSCHSMLSGQCPSPEPHQVRPHQYPNSTPHFPLMTHVPDLHSYRCTRVHVHTHMYTRAHMHTHTNAHIFLYGDTMPSVFPTQTWLGAMSNLSSVLLCTLRTWQQVDDMECSFPLLCKTLGHHAQA